MNGTIDEGAVDVAKEEEATGSDMCFEVNEVGSVRVNVEDHVTSAVQFCSVGIGLAIVKEVRGSLDRFLGTRVGLDG